MTDKEKNEMIEKMIADPDWGIAQLKAVKARRENKKARRKPQTAQKRLPRLFVPCTMFR